MNSLSIENISFAYPHKNKSGSEKVFSLNNVSFSVNEGEFLSIAGPNGSGKSTILKLINRIILPGSGSIKIFENDYTKISRKNLSKLLAYVPQNYSVSFAFTAFEIVLMGRSPYLRNIGFESNLERKIAVESMEMLDILTLLTNLLKFYQVAKRNEYLSLEHWHSNARY